MDLPGPSRSSSSAAVAVATASSSKSTARHSPPQSSNNTDHSSSNGNSTSADGPSVGSGSGSSAGAASSTRRPAAVSENIQVFIRIRPLIAREQHDQQQQQQQPAHSIRVLDDRTIEVRTAETAIQCAYDAVFDPSCSQEAVYDRVRECTQAFLSGFNATLFAYGQTGSGKSFTMFGSEEDASRYRPGLQKSHAGIIPRAIKDIFEGIVQLTTPTTGTSSSHISATSSALVFCSFVQVYNEQLFDLLRDRAMASPLEIHEDRTHGIYVEGLSEYAVRSVTDCLALLQGGEQHRAVRATHMNHVSSRSHSVFQLQLEQRRPDGTTLRSKFNLVDLAGSEKWYAGGADMQHIHISEMTSINLSLHTLGRCIAALGGATNGVNPHVPFRDSKLTRLLQDSLGGNTKTKIIATLSPSADCVDESIATLKFADRAKQVMVTVRVNELREVDPAYVVRLEDELQRLKEVVRLLQSASEEGTSGGEGDLVEARERDEDQEGEGGGVAVQRLKKRLAQLMQENMTLKERSEVQQQENAQLRARLMTSGGGSGTAGDVSTYTSSEANLAQAKQRLEDTLRQLKDASDRFFKFEIEEEELRAIHDQAFKGTASSFPLAISIPKARACGFPSKPSMTKAASLSVPPQTLDLMYRVRGRSSSIGSHNASNPPSCQGNNNNGSHNSSRSNEWRMDAAAAAHKAALDPEKQLELSRRAVEKQQKLQNWLLEKEKRELMRLQQEQDAMEEQRRLLVERDAKFFKHAQATKKKLQQQQQQAPDKPEKI